MEVPLVNSIESKQVRLSSVPLIIERRTGEAPHIATIYRWVNSGLRGAKLRTTFVGGHRRTTEQWLNDFFAEVNKAHCRRRDTAKD